MPSYVPEISYGDTSPETVTSSIIAAVEASLDRKLYPADPLRLIALAFAAVSIDVRNQIDEAGRQNLLTYATGANLDVLGDLVGVIRLAAAGAITTLRFTADAPAAGPITIPAGTRATPDGTLNWATDYAAVIGTGGTFVDVPATCQTTGTAGNGFVANEIGTIVDVVAHVPTVANTTTSADGADVEANDAFRIRIRLGIARFSVAGPVDAYVYWAKSASTEVSDVHVESPSPGDVNVYILATGGAIPGSDLLDLVDDTVNADDIRPLTDNVTVLAPTETHYTVSLTYYIRTSDAVSAPAIQAAVSQAVTSWIAWQRARIGRDINTSELLARIVNAGAKRASVASPAFTVINSSHLATITGGPVVTYGGLEDE